MNIARCIAIGLLLCVSAIALALPQNFSLENRTVLIQRDGKAASAAPASFASFDASLSPEQAKVAYLLQVAGTPPKSDWEIGINGKKLEMAPTVAPDGYWYPIPAGTLAAGSNQITVAAPKGETGQITSLLGFSINLAEEERLKNFVIAPAPPAVDPLQYGYDVQHMDVAVTLDTASRNLPAASVTITARTTATTPLTQCVLDFNDNSGQLIIDSVEAPVGTATTYSWNTGTEKLTVNLSSAVPTGSVFTVKVNYHGTPHSNAYKRNTHGSSVPVIWTNFQPYDARMFMPCKDLPEDKFTINLHVTVPTVSYNGYPWSVVSNGTLTTETSGGNTIYHWSEAHPVMTQYVSLCCSNYQVAQGTYTGLTNTASMPVAHHLYPESYAAESIQLPLTIEVVRFFAEMFGEYPFLSEKYVTAIWQDSGGMEHQTCTSMPPNNLDEPYHRRNIHELGHMWFGDAVGCHTFRYLWLSEGWASYMESLWLEHKPNTDTYSSRMTYYETSSVDTFPVESLQADGFTYGVVYAKPAFILHMLRHVVGDTAFFAAAKNYMLDSNLRYKTAVRSDFQQHVEAAYGQNLSWFFDQWLLRASRPAYQWSWSPRQSGSNWYVDIWLNQTQSDSPYIMPIDFGVTYADSSVTSITVNNNQRTQSFSVNVGTKRPTDMSFDPENFILGSGTEVAGPEPPTMLSVIGDGVAHTATITWAPSSTPGISGYRLYQSANGIDGWSLVRNESTLGPGATSTVITGLPKGTTLYFQLKSVATTEGSSSDIYGTRIGLGQGTVLIVDGYDRLYAEDGLNHDYAASHGRGIANHTNAFDTCANEAVGASVSLTSYRAADNAVVWFCGEESTTHETFSTAEQNLVKTFLEGGGKLFVTGNEIGWDLGRAAGSSDQQFYNNYLKAAYSGDDSGNYTVNGTAPTTDCFPGRTFTVGGTGAPYTPGWPDFITATGGSTLCLTYGTGTGAGVQYKGTFGAGTTAGAVVYLGFAFETVNSEAQRLQMMYDVLQYFGVDVPVTLSGFELE